MAIESWGAGLLALALATHTPQVYKCTGHASVSYQSQPCSEGMPEKAWDAVPDREPSAAERRRLERLARENALRNRPPRRRGVRVRTRQVESVDRCASTKARRDEAYRKVGLKRSFAFSSEWDARVQDACR